MAGHHLAGVENDLQGGSAQVAENKGCAVRKWSVGWQGGRQAGQWAQRLTKWLKSAVRWLGSAASELSAYEKIAEEWQ